MSEEDVAYSFNKTVEKAQKTLNDKSQIRDSGNRRDFGTGAVRDMAEGKGRMDLLPWKALIFVAKHFEGGAEKYGENNWKKGISLKSYMDSGLRHAAKVINAEDDEPHLRAICWNFLCLLETAIMIREGKLPQELNDIPGFDLETMI